MPSEDRKNELPEAKPFLTISGKGLSATTTDIIAIGVLALAICAGIVAIIVAAGWALGKIEGEIASKTILGSVGGSTISGIVSALVGRRRK